MERKNNKFTDLHFFVRSLLWQTKSLRIVEKKQYSGKPYLGPSLMYIESEAVYGNIRMTKVR